MKNQIYKNREVLRGLSFDVSLCDEIYQFKIYYVNEKQIKVVISISYKQMSSGNPDSFPGIVKQVIFENSANNSIPLYRQAFLSQHKLKKVFVIIDGIKFYFDKITNSKVLLAKFTEYDELLDSNSNSFVVKLREVIEDNLLENPPEVKRIPKSQFKEYIPNPASWALEMHFQEVGHVKKVISEEKLEESRRKHKKEAEREKRNREKMEKLEKEIGLNKPVKTKNLDKFFR